MNVTKEDALCQPRSTSTAFVTVPAVPPPIPAASCAASAEAGRAGPGARPGRFNVFADVTRPPATARDRKETTDLDHLRIRRAAVRRAGVPADPLRRLAAMARAHRHAVRLLPRGYDRRAADPRRAGHGDRLPV